MTPEEFVKKYYPEAKKVEKETGFHYLDTSSVITNTKDIESNTNIGLFEQFYQLNNSLRYCNGSHYEFQDKQLEFKYKEWLNSDDYKTRSFELYYGNGIVD